VFDANSAQENCAALGGNLATAVDTKSNSSLIQALSSNTEGYVNVFLSEGKIHAYIVSTGYYQKHPRNDGVEFNTKA